MPLLLRPATKSRLLATLFLGGLWCMGGCQENTITSDNEGCEALAELCPSGTRCQIDELGNAFCARMVDPPIASGAERVEPESTAGTMEAGTEIGGTGMVGGEMAGTEGIGGGAAGTEMVGGEMAGTDIMGGEMAGTEPVMCGTFDTNLKPAEASIPQVMLVVDRSYSMVNSEDRWTPALRAISQVTQALEEGVFFGLTLFPDPTSNAIDPNELMSCESWGRGRLSCEEDVMACVPGRVMVNSAVNNSFSIREALNNYPPLSGQGTPTYSALQEAANALLQQQGTSSEKVIILVTDGMPACNFDIDPNTCNCLSLPFGGTCGQFAGMCLDDNRTIQEITRLAGLGIKTIVVGMTIGLPDEGACIDDDDGDWCPYGGQACVNGMCVNLAPSVLSAMARAGGDSSGDYYSVDNVSDIESQVTAATASIAPCVFDIQNIPPNVYDQLVVYLDGEVVPRDPNRMNGWWAERGILEFYGNTCDSIRDGMSHRIAARCE